MSSIIKKIKRTRRRFSLKNSNDVNNIDVSFDIIGYETNMLFLVNFFKEYFKEHVLSLSIVTEDKIDFLVVDFIFNERRKSVYFSFNNNSLIFETYRYLNRKESYCNIGRLNSIEKKNLLKFFLFKEIKDLRKGIVNEFRAINLVREVFVPQGYTLRYSNYFDHRGVDFFLQKDNKKYCFQVKSSLRRIEETKKIGKIFFRNNLINFLLVNENITDENLLKQIYKKLPKIEFDEVL